MSCHSQHPSLGSKPEQQRPELQRKLRPGQSLGWCRHRSVPAGGPARRAQQAARLKQQQSSNVESSQYPPHVEIEHSQTPGENTPATVRRCELSSSLNPVNVRKRDEWGNYIPQGMSEQGRLHWASALVGSAGWVLLHLAIVVEHHRVAIDRIECWPVR